MPRARSVRALGWASWVQRTSVFSFLPLVCLGGVLTLGAYRTGHTMVAEAVVIGSSGSALAQLAWLDVRRRAIPNGTVYPALVIALLASFTWHDRGLVDGIAGGAVALGLASAVWTLSKGGLGGGDVKLFTLVGVLVGHSGLLLATAVTAVSGGLAAGALLAMRRAAPSAALPYGPCIALGALTALLR